MQIEIMMPCNHCGVDVATAYCKSCNLWLCGECMAEHVKYKHMRRHVDVEGSRDYLRVKRI
ncbi:hypothetical protein J4402_03650 [Candidatus Pacearchaeota archaeon]|nr:hypothetical protein [Candidatus Pacearchaeota archaeon]